MLNDTPTGTMTVPRSTRKIKKCAVAQFQEIPTLPQNSWNIPHAHSLQPVTLWDPMDCRTPAFPVHHISLWNSVQFSHTVVSNSLWPMDCSTPGLPLYHQLLELTQTHIHWVVDAYSHLIFSCPLLLPPSIFPIIRVFSNQSVLGVRWPKYWSFSFSISPSKVYSGLISFRMDWLDLLAVRGTLQRLLQHHRSKASVLWLSAFFMVQHSHPYMTTGKTIALTKRTFLGKVVSLLFNMLSRLVIAFLLRASIF